MQSLSEDVEKRLYLSGIMVGALDEPAMHRFMGAGESLSFRDGDWLLSSVVSLLYCPPAQLRLRCLEIWNPG